MLGLIEACQAYEFMVRSNHQSARIPELRAQFNKNSSGQGLSEGRLTSSINEPIPEVLEEDFAEV